MNQPLLDLPEYLPHNGTLRISGLTVPRKAAWRALSLLDAKTQNVEFMFIGATAGQAAVKAIGILADLFEEKYKTEFVVVFQPLRYKTLIEASQKEVDAQVWRAHVIDLGFFAAKAHEAKSSS